MSNLFLFKNYEILEIKPGASKDEIKTAYRDMCKVWHPDRFSGNPRLQKKADNKLKEINQAYKTLLDYFNTQPHPQQTASANTWESPPPPPHENRYQEPNFDNLNTDFSEYERRSFWSSVIFYTVILVILLSAGFCTQYFFKKENQPVLSTSADSVNPETVTPVLDSPSMTPTALQEVSAEPTAVSTPSIVLPKNTPVPPSHRKTIPDKNNAFITLGSHIQEILDIQGKPNQVIKSPLLDFEIWTYGESTYTISIKDDAVVEWNNAGKNLKIRLAPGAHTTNSFDITQGSHRDDVLRLKGTPDKIIYSSALQYTIWYYGLDSCKIAQSDNRVIDISEGIPTPPTQLKDQYLTSHAN